MKIDFNKRITGQENLKDFLGDELRYSDAWGIAYSRPYQLKKLASHSVDTIEEKLKKSGLDVTRSGVNSLWVSDTNPFALELKVIATSHNGDFQEPATYPN